MPKIVKRVRTSVQDTVVGMDSALDLFPQPVRETHPWYWDWLALRGDFEVTGRDMRRAMAAADERRRRSGTDG